MQNTEKWENLYWKIREEFRGAGIGLQTEHVFLVWYDTQRNYFFQYMECHFKWLLRLIL